MLLPVITLIAALAVSSCTFRKLLLNNADWLAMRQIDSFFDINSKQRKQINPEVKATVAWVKSEKFPELSALLTEMKKAWELGITAEKLAEFDVRISAFRVEIVNQIATPAGVFLASLSDDQIKHLEQELADSNKRLEKLVAMTPEEFASKRRDRVLENLEEWFGDLSKGDGEKLINVVGVNRDRVVTHLEGRRVSQKTFVDFLRTRPTPEAISAQLKLWADQPETMRGAYADRYISWRKESQMTLLEIDKAITPEQRFLSLQRMQEFIRDLSPSI